VLQDGVTYTVASTSVLTISAGVVVQFGYNSQLVIQGRLWVNGTASNHVSLVSSYGTTTTTNSWQGISFTSTAQPLSLLSDGVTFSDGSFLYNTDMSGFSSGLTCVNAIPMLLNVYMVAVSDGVCMYINNPNPTWYAHNVTMLGPASQYAYAAIEISWGATEPLSVMTLDTFYISNFEEGIYLYTSTYYTDQANLYINALTAFNISYTAIVVYEEVGVNVLQITNSHLSSVANGIYIQEPYNSNTTITNTYISATYNAIQATWQQCLGVYLERNTFTTTLADSSSVVYFTFSSSSYTAGGLVFTNNTITNSVKSGADIVSMQFQYEVGSAVVVTNNVFSSNTGMNMLTLYATTYYSSSTFFVTGNTFVNNNQTSTLASPPPPPPKKKKVLTNKKKKNRQRPQLANRRSHPQDHLGQCV